MSKVTIYDVAAKAECSSATVSLVLNNSPLVKEKTRERVMQIIDELGYVPNTIARSLITQSTKMIGLIIPDIENPLYAKMISGIEEVAQKNNFDIILGISEGRSEKENYYIDLLKQRMVDGMIIFPTYPEKVVEKLKISNSNDLSIVFCGTAYEEDDNISYVKTDNNLGAFKAVNHLFEVGRKKIGCVFPVSNKRQYKSRLEGYKKSLSEHSVVYQENLIKVCEMDNNSIFEATKELLKEKPDGIFCLYDYASIIVMKAIESSGFRVPEDISVIGYDNIEISKYLTTALSTVDTRSKEVGALSAEILIKQIKEGSPKSEYVLLEPKLVVRESTCKMPGI